MHKIKFQKICRRQKKMIKTNRILKTTGLLIAIFAISVSSNAQNKVSKNLQEARKAIADANLIYFDFMAKMMAQSLAFIQKMHALCRQMCRQFVEQKLLQKILMILMPPVP